ncbi:M16 family metallopeptidase [Actinomadura alba]|uniref:M16 family metallopeptidase n=1 Tax=Actinomadura alba TaxID=406431 RepID=UPI0028ACE47C|nr:pitrilysin family protein [Actinomadura alba]
MKTAPLSESMPARPTPGPMPPWTFPAAEPGRLGNGLATLHSDLPDRRLAAVRLVLDAGAGREPAGLDGVANLTASALLEGTEAGGGTTLTAAFDRLGATLNAGADLTALRIALDVPVTRLADALALLSSVIRSPALADADVRRLARERLEEIAQDDADPHSRARRELRAVMFPADSRSSRPTGGDPDTVGRITGADVRAFYSSIVPAQATVVAAGDLAGIDVEALLGTALGDFATTGSALPAPDMARPGPGPRMVIVHRPGAVQTQLSFGHGVPGRDHPDWAALAVAAHVLGGGLSSRLNALLREEKGYTYGMRAALLRLRHCGIFIAEAAVHTEATAPAVADSLTSLRSVLDGITDKECASTISALADRAPANYETARAVAAELADAAASDLPIDHPQRHLDAIRATTPQRAAEAYAAHVKPDELTIVAVGDADQIRDPLAELGFAEVEVVAPEG